MKTQSNKRRRILKTTRQFKGPWGSPETSSYAALAYEKSTKAFEKREGFDSKAIKSLKIEDKEHFKSVSISAGYSHHRAFTVLRSGLSVFHLHEAIRSTFPVKSTANDQIVFDVLELRSKDQEKAIHALGSLIVLNPWEPEKYGKKAEKSKNKEEKAQTIFLITDVSPKKAEALFERGVKVAESTNVARTLAKLPGNILNPGGYVKRAKDYAREWGVEFSFIDRKKLKSMGANAFLAVVAADPASECGIARLRYRPRGKSIGKLALVGKGMCFDTGGYDVKISGHMLSMNEDMTGSAIALSLMKLFVESRAPFEVDAYLAIAENLISPSAYRPNDVVIARNGLSIEVVDTDAEGRMVLSDTLAIASEEKPDLIIDFATLTGACVRALDTARSGVFSNRERLLKLGMECGEESGERTWGFPIGDDYWKGIESDIADLRQCAHGSNSDHIFAATFLSAFVAPGIDWIHMDLSANERKGGLGLVCTDTTGFGVRWADEVVSRYFGRR